MAWKLLYSDNRTTVTEQQTLLSQGGMWGPRSEVFLWAPCTCCTCACAHPPTCSLRREPVRHSPPPHSYTDTQSLSLRQIICRGVLSDRFFVCLFILWQPCFLFLFCSVVHCHVHRRTKRHVLFANLSQQSCHCLFMLQVNGPEYIVVTRETREWMVHPCSSCRSNL